MKRNTNSPSRPPQEKWNNTSVGGKYDVLLVGVKATGVSISSDIQESGKNNGGTSTFRCPDENQVIVGRVHSGDENGITQYKYGQLSIVSGNDKGEYELVLGPVQLSSLAKESNSMFSCGESCAIVGRSHSGDENGNTQYYFRVISIRKKSKNTIYPLSVASAYSQSIQTKESSGNWVEYATAVVSGSTEKIYSPMHTRKHSGDENGTTVTSFAMFTATVPSDYEMNYDDTQDFSDCLRGRIKMNYPTTINNGNNAIWDFGNYAFIPDIKKPEDYNSANKENTVHNSLWRQAQLNKIHGLFEVCEGIYQFRGYDMANITIVEDTNGIIIIDCSTAKETAQTALELYRKHRGHNAVKAVVLTHSHTDHYGGIGGIIGNGENIPIYAPENFVTEAALENVLVGDAMSRRSTYMYGTFLKAGTDGHVDSGLGKAIAKGGSVGFLSPTIAVVPKTYKASSDIVYECTPLKIGGGSLEIEFMLCPHTEAPAEMTVYIHGKEVLIGAEILNHTLHNMLTPRGAEVRDARLWWKAIDKLIDQYIQVEIICATHHWPIWNCDDIGYPYPGNPCGEFLCQQRDTYKFLHDQTVRLINKGYTMLELAAYFDDPENLPNFMKNLWHNRGYYGTISHDVRAIYQKYLGWYDMNPANLNPLPPEEAAKEYVAAMGGEAAVIQIIDAAIAGYKLRWAAELGKHLVFANPTETNRMKLAGIFTSLGYACEAGTWRDIYLTGAAELKNGRPLSPGGSGTSNPAILNNIDDDLFYDFAASRLNGQKAMNVYMAFVITMNDAAKLVEIANGVLNFHPSDKAGYKGFSVSRADFTDFLLGKIDSEALWNKLSDVNASEKPAAIAFFDLFDQTAPAFNIALP